MVPREVRGQAVAHGAKTAICLSRWIGVLAVALGLLSTLALADQTLRIAVISDLNGSYGSTDYHATVSAAVTRIIGLEPDLVISTGDMVGGQRRPHLDRQQLAKMWQAFHAAVSQPLAVAAVPVAVTPGNHDASAYGGFERERRMFAEQWSPRRPQVRFLDDSSYPFHYAFELGGVLFVSLDATVVGHLPRSQMDWLRQVLERHGAGHRARVVFSHLPLWPFTQGREREYIGDPELQTLLQEQGVDLFLSGHHHAFYPGVKDGVTFVSQACLGAGPRPLIGSSSKSPRSFTLIEFAGDGIGISALQGSEFTVEIDWTSLPKRVRSPVAELTRADLVE